MKINKLLLLFIIPATFLTSCYTDQDDVIDDGVITNPDNLDIERFVYRGMNDIYLYKANIPELADNYFESNNDKNEYLASFDSPENLFYNGLVYNVEDRFSYITDDYTELENSQAGISTTTGMNYRLSYYNNSSNLIAFVRYVLPNTPAENKNVKRGMLFNKVDGVQLTDENYLDLLNQENFTLHLASLESEAGEYTAVETGETIDLSKIEYTSNPVYVSKTLTIEGKKIGYLMYNSFTGDFDDDLNEAFANFKTDGISDLILDLRYNGGGSVLSATRLASMITGQHTGKTFMKEQWNEEYQAAFEQIAPERLENKFVDTLDDSKAINSLNSDHIYVITSAASASASELVINGLDPYIEVQKVGDTTVGKFQASVTLYDSPDFDRQNRNPDHSYALQPLVFKSVNSEDISVPFNGIIPDLALEENPLDLGELGDEEEPLLAATIDVIFNRRTLLQNNIQPHFKEVGESGENAANYQKMYIEKLPVNIPNKAQQVKE